MQRGKAKFSRTFAAAHRLQGYDGKCVNIHGHNYTAEVIVDTALLDGMTIDYSVIKDVIDDYDHSTVLELGDPLIKVFQEHQLNVTVVPCAPTTENLSRFIAQQVLAMIVDSRYGQEGAGDKATIVIVNLSKTYHISAQGFATDGESDTSD